MLFRLNGKTVYHPFKRFIEAFKRFAHPFNASPKTFKRFAHPFKKLCIRLTLKGKRLNGLLIRLKRKPAAV